MTRRYWAGVMVFAILVTFGAGWYLLTALQERALVDVPLQPAAEGADAPSALPEEANEDGASSLPAETAPNSAVAVSTTGAASPASEAAAPEAESAPATRNILFTFYSSYATEIAIVGDFNDWIRAPLKKRRGNRWTRAVGMEPGTYEYMFIVDGRRTRDPNNRRVSANGNSVITVDPLPSP